MEKKLSCAFFVVKCFICKISQNYTDLWFLLDIKVLTQQANVLNVENIIKKPQGAAIARWCKCPPGVQSA